MSNIRNLLVAMLVAGTGNAVAASSVDLAVKGAITPSACTPSFSNGGVVDFGKLSVQDLKVETYTRLDSQYMQLKVDCEAETLIALRGDDNRAGTAFREEEGNFGLGLINGDERLGAFWGEFSSAVADGVPARFIQSMDGGATWNSGAALWREGITSVANNSTVTPMPVKVWTGEMEIKTIIAPTNTLTLTEEVPIDGSVTVTLVYL